MSARQPFVPQPSRTPSRPAQVPDENNDPQGPGRQGLNTSAPSNTKHTKDHNNSSQQQQKMPGNGLGLDTSLLSGTNKPLNISAFPKKQQVNNSGIAGIRASKHSDDPASRARSPKTNTLRVAAPRPSSPFFPNSSNMVSMNSFRTPISASALGTTSVSVSDTEALSSNAAHIPTPGAGDSEMLSFGRPIGLGAPPERFAQGQGHSIMTAKPRSRSSTRPSLEKIHEATEHDDPDGYRTTLKHTDTNAYNHPFDGDGNTGADQHNHAQAQSQGLRRMSKRIARTDDEDEELEYGPAKRYKVDHNGEYMPPNYSSRPSSPTMQYTDEPAPAQAPAYRPPVSQPAPVPEHALRRLLGQDLDLYATEHMDAYEAAKKKWATCTLEEWTAGANEISGKFGELLDLVKTHMTTKLALYTSLHSAIGVHKKVLSDREVLLVEARDNLVKGGGNVVGGSTSTTSAASVPASGKNKHGDNGTTGENNIELTTGRGVIEEKA